MIVAGSAAAVPADDVDAPSPFPPVSLDLLADLGGIAWRRHMTADGIVSYPWMSANTAGILGYPPDQMAVNAKGALSIVHWADRDAHVAAIRASAAAMEPCAEQFRAITAAGETRWFQGTSRPRRLAGGGIAWDGLWLDNTPRMRAEVQLQMLMDHAEDCIFILGEDRITWSNAAAERNFGYLAEELTGRPFNELIDPPRQPGFDDADLAANHGGNAEITARRRDGTSFPFEMTVSEVRSDGKLSLIVIGRDITLRRTAEKRLEESEKRLRVAFAAASLGIVVVAPDGTIQFYNPAFETMAGSDYDTLLGVSLFRFVPNLVMPPLSAPPPLGLSCCVVCHPNLPDGAERHWRLTITQFSTDLDTDSHSVLCFIEDITEATQATRERRQLESMLHEGQKLEALGRLAGGIAHELNNMLGPILMGAEMVARSVALDRKNAERVQRIIDAAKNSRDIVRNVLAYCRKEQKEAGAIDLVPVFESFVGLATSTLPPTIRIQHGRNVDRAVAVANAGQIQQVLLNLANNARDAMDGAGTLVLALNQLSPLELAALSRQIHSVAASGDEAVVNPLAILDPDREHVEIKVGDTGSGMSRSVIAKIFDPFFTTKPVGQGTGLGLSVVQGIVANMGGAIAVDSAIGAGTTFHVILPLLHQEGAETGP
ncbi:PAS domain S-box protein [Magnetospirillum sp. SS-4]|uniref:PAS domain S-box protein n=1 Tax=Magnetospirillum sp. SS-4 TaxID=2681465 RepID=UPI001384A648|nr:PAS domain S-box protein [Magnetospirillum sp. SS-4]CAA7626342.1 putative PAS/PAC sensor protein [Magnetospirillum sp. SS-4]